MLFVPRWSIYRTVFLLLWVVSSPVAASRALPWFSSVDPLGLEDIGLMDRPAELPLPLGTCKFRSGRAKSIRHDRPEAASFVFLDFFQNQPAPPMQDGVFEV